MSRTITTKYDIGEEVWCMINNKPCHTTITDIIINVEQREIPNTWNQYKTVTNVSYKVQRTNSHFLEKELFTNKKDLIKYLFKDYD